MKNQKTKNIALTAIFAALVAALTMVHLPLPSEAGYVHFGDSMIYLCASFLPAPYALAASAIGGAQADLTIRYFNWIPFTFVIKAVNAVPFIIANKMMKKHKDKIVSWVTVLMTVASGLVTLVLYFFASWVVYGNAATAATDIPGSIVQALGSAIIYIIVGAALDTAKIKKKFFNKF